MRFSLDLDGVTVTADLRLRFIRWAPAVAVVEVFVVDRDGVVTKRWFTDDPPR